MHRHHTRPACGRALYYQATLTGRIGAVDCEGIADVLDVVRREDQALDITVIDIKASRRTSVSFCLQVAFYARLLKDALARAAVPVVRGAILAHGEAGATAALEPFDLALFEDDIERLLATPDADVQRVLHRPFAIADAHLSAKCDGCPYNALCFIDAPSAHDLSVSPCSRPQKTRLTACRADTCVSCHPDGLRAARHGARARRESDIARLSTTGHSAADCLRWCSAPAAVQRDDPGIAKPFSSAPALARYPIRNATLIWSRSSLTPSTTTSKTACICWPRWWPDQSRRPRSWR